MQFLKAFVKGVVDKGNDDKKYSVVGLEIVETDYDGFEKSTLIKSRVMGEDYKAGIQNAFRQAIGSEVFVPVSVRVDTYYKDSPRLDYRVDAPLSASQFATRILNLGSKPVEQKS